MSNPFDEQMPSRKKHVVAATLMIAALCIVLFLVNVIISGEIAREISVPPVGDSGWSRSLSIVKSVIENLIAGAIAALLLAMMFRTIVNFIDPRDRVIEISSGDITKRLKSNARNTQRYTFIGNTATFVTASVLPILVDLARLTNRPRQIDLFILDPINKPAVESYSAFKKQIANANSVVSDQRDAQWVQPSTMNHIDTEAKVLGKLVAAIYLAAFASLQTSMEVRIFLRRSFTPFRTDMTDKEVVLTQESTKEGAVAFSSLGDFYSWYHKEAVAQQNQAVSIEFAASRAELLKISLPHPTGDKHKRRIALVELLDLFAHLKPLTYRIDVVSYAVDRITKPTHSY